MIQVFGLLIFAINGCPFTSFEECVLPVDYGFIQIPKLVHIDSEKLSFSIGFWSLSLGIIQGSRYSGTKFHLSILENDNQKVVGLEQPNSNFLVHYTFYPNGETIEYYIPFYEHQDIWKFTLITFTNNFNSVIIEMSGQKKKKLNLKVLEQDHLYKFAIFCPFCPTLSPFRGRMSKLIFFENYVYKTTSFEKFQEYCRIPIQVTGPQIMNIVPGLVDFQGKQTLTVSFQEYGRKYCIQGWVKFPNSLIFSTQQILLRLSQNVYQPLTHRPGDDLFKIQYFISPSQHSSSKIILQIDSFCSGLVIPSCQLNFTQETVQQLYTTIHLEFLNTSDDSFYKGITSWHYFQYEYGRNVTNSIGMLFQMQFVNSVGSFSKQISEIFEGSYTNGMFYVYVGESYSSIDNLTAAVYDLNILYNYQQDKELLLYCHKSCLTCDGPLNTNCLSCNENSNNNLIYNSMFKKCVCKIGYLEVEENVCIKQEEYFSFITFTQQLDEIQNSCLNGYYIVPVSEYYFSCFQCPQLNSKNILCADCWINQRLWHLNPVCSSDFLFPEENYILTNRTVQEYDFYIINDDFELVQMEGFQGFCTSGPNCHSINNLFHLKQQIQATCKPNFIFSDNICHSFNYQCEQYDLNGQCLICSESYYSIGQICKQCPENCYECKYDLVSQKVICLQCLKNYGLKHNQCFKCGLYCQLCQEKKLDYSDQTLLACLKCIDDSDYYVSYDKVNCQKNQINDCKHVIEYPNVELANITFFNFQLDQTKGIFTVCALCKAQNTYIQESKACSTFITSNTICKFWIQSKGSYYCLFSDIQQGYSAFSNGCTQYIENCNLCLQGDFYTYACLQCFKGYYADRLFGSCQACPAKLNCKICAQQQKSSQDDWIQEIRPFFRQFIENYSLYRFTRDYQSQKIEDYEIICKNCNDGYVLINGLCIFQSLQEQCVKFSLVKSDLRCTSCQQNEINQIPTIVNNQCINCPENCAVCTSRSQEEKNIINAQFNDQKYISYSYQCLKGKSDQFYYDSLISQFVNCNLMQQCKNEITIKMNLICSYTDYQYQLDQHISHLEKIKYQQENILLDDLFSEISFLQYENDIFYKLANQNFVKEIYLSIQNKVEQNCTLAKQAVITQFFKEHIFSLQNVYLIFDFEEMVQITYSENITFKNFYQIEIKNVEFIPTITRFQKVIMFTSLQYQSLFFQNISVIQNNLIQNGISISMDKVFKLKIDNFSISNIILKDQNFFIFLKYQDQQLSLQILSMKIKNCILLNTTLFQFNLKSFDKLLIDNFMVESIFNNSSIINTIQSYSPRNTNSLSEYIGTASFSDFQITSQITDIDGFFVVEIFDKVIYSNFIVINSLINNSTIINFYSEISIINFRVIDSKIYGGSVIIENKNSSKLLIKLLCSHLEFENNEYFPETHFIQFRKLFSSQQYIDFEDFRLINNYGTNTEEIYKTYDKSLIYLEANNILISNLLIQKGFGITELFIKDATNFTLLDTIIKQVENFKFKCLHNQFECFNPQIKIISFVKTIQIYSTKQTFVQNLKIFDVQIFDFPIISYNSADEKILKEEELIIFQNIEISNNLLVQTNIQSTLSILQIISQQKMIISFNQCKFLNNVFHSYKKSYLKISSLLLQIDCSECSFILNNSQITKNFITNSSDSIIYINTQSIAITNSQFTQNSIFIYEIISQYLFWDYDYDEIFLEQLTQIYPISSETGNAYFIGEIIIIENTNISYSQGQRGGAFKFSGLDDCNIRLSKIDLFEITTIFRGALEQGGALNIDATQAQTIHIELSQMNIENIFSQNEGGFIYLKLNNQKAKIFLSSIRIKEVYAQQGSFAFMEFLLQHYNDQSFWLSNVTFQNSEQGFGNFLNKYRVLSEYDKIKLVFYITYGNNFYFRDFYINNLSEGLFLMYGIQKLIIQNIEIQDSTFQVFLIKVTPQQYIQNMIEIKLVNLFNITQSTNSYNFECFSKPDLQLLIKSQCNPLKQNQPKTVIEFYSIEKNLNQIKKCQDTESQNQLVSNSEGLIIFNYLSEKSKILIYKSYINQVNCNECAAGLFFYQYQVKNNITLLTSKISGLTILSSQCGSKGCLNLEKIIQNQYRLLQNQVQLISQNEFELNSYVCKNNTATFGVCLQILNFRAILNFSQFSFNKALKLGGAIYVDDSSLFLMVNSIIKANQAQIGGGLYFMSLPQIDYFQLKNLVQDNQGIIYGDNYKIIPESLNLQLQPNIQLEYVILSSNETVKIIQVTKADNTEIFFPNGQAVNSYKYFDLIKRSYYNPDYIFRLQALQFDGAQSKNLVNSFCLINSREINQQRLLEDEIFTNNFTNIKNISFDLETQVYNLDNLIIYFDPDQTQDIKLQLEFKCSSITVVEYEDNFPFSQKYFHNNYKLRLNIRTFPCQYGEFKNQTDKTCNLCNFNNGFYSLKLNEPKCQIKDDESTINVKSALLELKKGYWRPYFDSNHVGSCYNVFENCLGGWTEGDPSCKHGHIGALCEQCDIFNVRGDGHFAMVESFQCGSCNSSARNLTLLIFTIMWTLVNLFISVQGNQKIQDEYAKPQLFRYNQFQQILSKSQTGVLMKMLTTYLQIIASLTTFQLSSPIGITNFLNIAGNPIQTTATSQDCLVIDHIQSGIQYIRAVWLLMMPFLFISINLVVFLIASYMKLNQFNISIISTSILHIYLYFQPNMIGNLMQLLSYREISGYKWVKANVAVRYDTDLHFQWMTEFALPLLLLFAFFIPLFLLYNLFTNKQFQHKKEIKKIWGYLYHEYTPQTHYWEIVKIFQKELIIIFLSFFEEIIALKGILLILVTFSYSQFAQRKKPYSIKRLNDLDISSTNTCTVSACLAIGVYFLQQQSLFEVQFLFWFFLGYLNLKFLYLILSQIIFEYIRTFASMFEINQLRIAFPFLKKISWINQFLDRKIKQKIRTKLLFQKLKQIALPLSQSMIKQQHQFFQNLKMCATDNFEPITTSAKGRQLLISTNLTFSEECKSKAL